MKLRLERVVHPLQIGKHLILSLLFLFQTFLFVLPIHPTVPISQHLRRSITIAAMFSKLTTKIALHKAGLSGISLPTTNYTKSYTSTTSTSKNGIAGTEASDSQYPAFLTTNPFANVTMPKALNSWVTPPAAPIPVAMAPEMGTRAPTNLKLRLPAGDGSPTVVVFLRHCGCPCK
jgi:hypothetical protein